ncbi:ATP11-domain-containing protein [Pisolithus marmoratus]|nr:ATP11-domain-containing protein [Pisolithus marmoratus]
MPALSLTRATARRVRLTSYASVCRLRRLHTQLDTSGYDIKYADKLRQKAKEKGIDLDELKTQARREAHHKQKETENAFVRKCHPKTIPVADGVTQSTKKTPSPRKDSSPIKPLSSILNVTKLLAYTTYVIAKYLPFGPPTMHPALAAQAERYPSFVLPVPRQIQSETSPLAGTSEPAHEFFYLQWDFHTPPLQPSATEPDPFQAIPSTPSGTALPPVSTVLFTPLQEYKLRHSFATPYLVLTFHTDLSYSHDLVLLRGEITPSAVMTDAEPGRDVAGRYLLNQVDAQVLAMGIQKYYLWGKHGEARNSGAEKLLKQFHEKPDDFDWKELLRQSVITV